MTADGLTTGERVKGGGVVAIMDEPSMPIRGVASSPKTLQRILANGGIKSQLISAKQMANPRAFNAGLFDLLLLPTGQSFPIVARPNFIRFLCDGGSFISMGGYTFESLLWEENGQWLDMEAFRKSKPERSGIAAAWFRPMNTARGKPMNELKLVPEQIGVFDACFPLKRACRLARAEDQQIIRHPLDIRRELKGWAATGVVGDYGNNGIDFLRAKIATNARWVPVLQTYDRFGRLRGAAAALLLNFNGFYAGSNWAYFGIENFDLFDDPAGAGAQALQEVVRFLVRGTYLQQVTMEKRLLRRGEPLEAEAVVRNTGGRPQTLRVEFSVGMARAAQRELTLKPGEAQPIRVALGTVSSDTSLGQVTATLFAGGEPIDTTATGFVVESSDVIRKAADLRFAGNYFTRNGRPMFIFGSDETAYIYLTPHENPLTWSRDLLAARDIGMNLYENLQYSRPGHQMLDTDWRNFRAMAQLAQQYNMVFMPGMLVVHNVAVGDREIAEESRQCEGYARLLRDVPGCLHYLNGDCVYRPDMKSAELKELWNGWLRQRYATTDRLREAWGTDAVCGEIGTLEIPTKTSSRWDDAVAIDLVRFSQWLTARWNRAHLAAIRRHDRHHPITSEYYQTPRPDIHIRTTIEGHDVANIGLFVPVEAMPTTLRWNDLRTRGKGLSAGEYGMQAHPAWTSEGGPSRGYAMPRTEERQNRLFTMVVHYSLGLGAAKIQNWCLRDAQHRSIHPWGIFYAEQMVPKDVAYVHRNLSLIWRHFTPRYVAPSLAVCIPLNLGQGNQRTQEYAVPCRAFSTLYELHHDFNVFDDDHLDRLGPTTKTLIYPSPFAVSDATYKRLLAWVRAGGTLVITGDFSYDENRRRTGTGRIQELAGVEFISENYANITRESGKSIQASFKFAKLDRLPMTPCVRVKAAGAEVLGVGPQDEPVFVRHRVGRGTVYYATDPLELGADQVTAETRRRLYAAVLQSVSRPALAVEPNEPWLQVMAQPTARGTVHVVANTRDGKEAVSTTLATKAGPVTLAVRDRWPAMAAVTADGRLVAAFTDAKMKVNGAAALDGTGMKGILSLDGKDVRQSRALLIAPWEPGEVRLPRGGDFVAIVGDFRDGRWVTFERLSLNGSFTIDADQATCLMLLCPARDIEHRQQQLTEAMLYPERITGY